MIRLFLVGLLLLLALVPAQASATHFYSTRAEQALEALITTNSLCCSIARLYTHGGTLIGRLPTADGTVGQALTTNGAGTWSFSTIGPVGGAVGGSGTATHLARFTAAQTIGDATVTETAGALAGITTLALSSQLTSTLATGTPPFVVASTTNVVNLNASSLNGATFAAPGAIGGGTPGTAAFTTVTGTSFQGIIGNVTPAAGTFTTMHATGDVTVDGTALTFAGGNMTVALSAVGDMIFKSSSGGSEFRVKNSNGGIALVAGSSFTLPSGTTVVWNGDTTISRSAAGILAVPPLVMAVPANTVGVASTGYSVTGSGTSSLASYSGTLNTSGVTHVNDWSITDTAHGAGSTLVRIRGGGAGTTLVFSVDTNGTIVGDSLSVSGGKGISSTVGAATFSSSATAAGPAVDLFNNVIHANTSGAKQTVLIEGTFAPGSGSGSHAALEILPTINGTSSGIAYGLLLASKTNTLTGGKIKLWSAGTTTTDGFTGYTPLAELWVSGGFNLGGTIDPGAGNVDITGVYKVGGTSGLTTTVVVACGIGAVTQRTLTITGGLITSLGTCA